MLHVHALAARKFSAATSRPLSDIRGSVEPVLGACCQEYGCRSVPAKDVKVTVDLSDLVLSNFDVY